MAKIASDLQKPDGLVVVREDEVPGFLAKLPIERMWGIGPKTAPRLRAMGFSTLGDFARTDPKVLEAQLGAWGLMVYALARGEDARDVDPGRASKSVGAEETYEEDLTDAEAIARTLLAHAGRVAGRLLHEGYLARTVTTKIKYSDFKLVARRTALAEPACDTDTIYMAACAALARVPLQGRRVRLTGVSASDLLDGPAPPTLFPDPVAEKRRKVEEVAAQVRERFSGGAVIKRATLLR